LLRFGADPNKPDREGITPAGIADLLELDDVQAALKKPLPPVTSLYEPLQQGDHATLERLLQDGANPNDYDPEGRPLLMAAIDQDDLESLALLLSFGATPQAVDRSGTSVLVFAHNRNQQQHLEALKAAQIKQLDCLRLIAAVRSGDVDAVKALVQREGINLNIMTHDRVTPLFEAIYRDHLEVARILYQNGANPDIETNRFYKISARQLSIRSNQSEEMKEIFTKSSEK
jgi:ankyrin repeat protein